MRSCVMAVALLALAACASAPPPLASGTLQALQPLTAAQLRQATEGRIICRNPAGPDVCGSIVALTFNGDTFRMDDGGVVPIDFYLQRGFTNILVAEPWFEARYGELFRDLGRRRTEGGYDHIRLSLRYDAVYDPATRAWCTADRPDARVLDNATAAFTRNQNTSREGDWPFPALAQTQIIQMIEDLFASPNVQPRFTEGEIDATREALRNARATCHVFYGFVRENGAVELRRIGSTWPNDVARVAPQDELRVHPADAILGLL